MFIGMAENSTIQRFCTVQVWISKAMDFKKYGTKERGYISNCRFCSFRRDYFRRQFEVHPTKVDISAKPAIPLIGYYCKNLIAYATSTGLLAL
jgi:hypothetical protein